MKQLSLTQRWIIFGVLTFLTVGLGIFAGVWIVFAIQSQAQFLFFGQTLPLWLIPAALLYLVGRNGVRLVNLRSTLLEGDGAFDLRQVWPSTWFKKSPVQVPLSRQQRRQIKRSGG